VVIGLAAANNSKMQLYMRFWRGKQTGLHLACPSQCLACSRVPKAQSRIRTELDAAHFCAHQRAKEGVDKSKDAFVAAEIIRQRNDLTASWIILPFPRVRLKDVRVRQAKPIDTLLDVANEKAIRLRSVTTQRACNRILGGIDVLVFIHKNELEPGPPVLGQSSGFSGIVQQE